MLTHPLESTATPPISRPATVLAVLGMWLHAAFVWLGIMVRYVVLAAIACFLLTAPISFREVSDVRNRTAPCK